MRSRANSILTIVGPTASGKTSASLELVKNLQKKNIISEIINSDSIQLYKDLKILMAFPSEEQLREIPHHLFGILDANEKISVAQWKNLAESKIDELHKNKKIPVLCGGTGFYINSIVKGISNIPEIPKEHRKKVSEKFILVGREKFFEELLLLDPKICSLLHPNNTQRILRAYEVVTFTGKPLTFWWEQEKIQKHSNIKIVVILPNREQLHKSILDRIHRMLKNGAIEEVIDFLKLNPNYNGPLNKVIGFEEIKEFLNTNFSKEELIEKIFIKTRQYAKRQTTWFRYQMKDAVFLESSSQILQSFQTLI